MVIAQGEIWWADLGEPVGSAPGYVRPVIVVQADHFNRSNLRTVVCVTVSGQLRWANVRGNVLLKSRDTGLDRDSVAITTQIVTLDRAQLSEQIGSISKPLMARVLDGIAGVLGR